MDYVSLTRTFFNASGCMNLNPKPQDRFRLRQYLPDPSMLGHPLDCPQKYTDCNRVYILEPGTLVILIAGPGIYLMLRSSTPPGSRLSIFAEEFWGHVHQSHIRNTRAAEMFFQPHDRICLRKLPFARSGEFTGSELLCPEGSRGPNCIPRHGPHGKNRNVIPASYFLLKNIIA